MTPGDSDDREDLNQDEIAQNERARKAYNTTEYGEIKSASLPPSINTFQYQYQHNIHSIFLPIKNYARNTKPSAMATLGEALETLGFGTNRYNPTDLPDNCVFVTIAFLLDMKPEQLVRWIQQRMPTGGGVLLPKVFDLLTESRIVNNPRGLSFEWHCGPGTTLSSPMAPSGILHVLFLHKLLVPDYDQSGTPFSPRGVAVCYYRQSGPGHCCTVQDTPQSIEHPNGLKYICYQSDPAGRDLTWDAEASTIRLIFCFNSLGYNYWYYPLN